MGHRNDLRGVYYNPDLETRFNEFKKAIPKLTIDDSIRLEEELKNKNEQFHDLESDKDRRMDSLEIMIHELAKRLEAKS